LLASGVPIIERRVEEVDLDTFDRLASGDLLFIDSTHAVRIGGDVLHLYLRVIPRLKPGVVIHIHDIYLPYLHQRDLLSSPFQWTETALLLALLTCNPKLRVLVCLSQLHYERPNDLRSVFPEYQPQSAEHGLARAGAPGHFPASIFLQTV